MLCGRGVQPQTGFGVFGENIDAPPYAWAYAGKNDLRGTFAWSAHLWPIGKLFKL